MIYLNNLREMDNSESSIGVIRKWYDEENHHYIKASAMNKAKQKYHVEAIMECIAFEVGQLLGIDAVPYWLDKLYISENEMIDVCVSEDYRYVRPIKDVISANSYLLKIYGGEISRLERYRVLTKISEDLRKEIDKMIIYDYLIDNHDRHLRNIEISLLKDGTTTLSPIFDNGSSLLADWLDEDLFDLKADEDLFDENIVYAQTTSKAFSNEHAGELRLVDRKIYQDINLNIPEESFKKIVEKYSDYISPIRKEMICQLLIHRYQNIKKHADLI